MKKKMSFGKAAMLGLACAFGAMLLVRCVAPAFASNEYVEECKDEAMIEYIEEVRDCKDRLDQGRIQQQCLLAAKKAYYKEAAFCEEALSDLEDCNSVLYDCDEG